ncbi:MAG: primosomal protein N', partial [Candidatus Caenarcaniphilales bacterium]|nr:primosomal protein N' [Candidatus Caenarcaniphilales bacterium]
ERMQQAFCDEEIFVWHSNLSDGKRIEAWEKCLSGEAKIIVGARSAVFAPIENIGLIIVDEEHDGSFKSGNKPFYDAKLIAEERAKENKAVLLFGSATPSVDTFYDLKAKDSVLELLNRFRGQEMPSVEIVDMRQELNDGNRSIFSRTLKKALNQCVENKEQAILLLNRRGFANYVFCRDCGYAHFCDHCSVPLIYHTHGNSMRCHHCNAQTPLLKECPECRSPRIKQAGLGTQRLELEVKRHFPEAEVVRLDRDISSKRNGMQEVWDKLNSQSGSEKSQILVGTQLVAKGMDLPNVTLVSAIHAESGLFSTDFNAAERTFQLLTQAAGRAGRHDKPGKVIFQTYNPENKIIQFAAKHDYHSFYEAELLGRQEFRFPPFVQLARFVISNEDDILAGKDSEVLATYLRKDLFSAEVLGPAPCPIEKVNKLYRWHILLKTDFVTSLQEIGRINLRTLNLRSRIIFDLMPNSLV